MSVVCGLIGVIATIYFLVCLAGRILNLGAMFLAILMFICASIL